jgi:hypothetical protein
MFINLLSSQSQPSTPILNLRPILFSERCIRLIPRRNPQKVIILTTRYLGPNKRRVYSLVTQWHLILLMVMDVCGIIDYTQEDRHSVARQLGAGVACEGGVVEGLSGFGADLQSSTAGAAFVVGEADAVNVGFLDTREFSDYFGDLGGGPVGVSVYSMLNSGRGLYTYTFSLFQRKVSPSRSRKYQRPSP